MTSSPAPSAPPVRPQTPPQVRLDERYGRTNQDGRRVRTVSIVAAVAFVAVFAAWVVWAGLSGTNASLEVRELGYLNDTDTSVDIQWEVSVEPGTEVTCALQALNGSFGIVGWRIVELGTSEQRTRQYSETVRTSERPVTGLPYRCWLP